MKGQARYTSCSASLDDSTRLNSAAASDSPPVTSEASTELSQWTAAASLLKCAVGAGCFTLPHCFAEGGILATTIIVVAVGSICCYTACLLLHSDIILQQSVDIPTDENPDDEDSAIAGVSAHTPRPASPDRLEQNSYEMLPGQGNRRPHSVKLHTFPDLGAKAFPDLTVAFRHREFNLMWCFVTLGIILTALGVCAAYIDFILSVSPSVLSHWTGRPDIFNRNTVLLFVVTPGMLILAFLRDFQELAFSSILGFVSVMLGVVVVLSYGLYESPHGVIHWVPIVSPQSINPSQLSTATNTTRQMVTYFLEVLPFIIGNSNFLFAIHVSIYPILQQTGSRQDRPAANCRVAFLFYLTLIVFNVLFGIAGNVLFSASTCYNADGLEQVSGPCPNILNNMKTGFLLDAVKIALCIDLGCSIPILLAAVRTVIEVDILPALLQGYDASKDAVEMSEELEQYRSSAPVTPISEVDNPLSHRHCLEVESTDSSRSKSTQQPLRLSRFLSRLAHKLIRFPLSLSRATLQFCLIRSLLAFVVLAIAVGIPSFSRMVSLIGGVNCAITSFLLPPIIFMRLSQRRTLATGGGLTSPLLWMIIFIGLTILVSTLYTVS